MLLTRPIPVNFPQRSPEWFASRLGNITGSIVGDTFLNVSDLTRGAACREILGVSALTPKIKATEDFQKLWEMDPIELLEQAGMEIPETEKRKKIRQDKVGERLTGIPADPDPFVNYEMKWGIINEPLAIAKYQRFTGLTVKEAPFYLHQTIDTETGEIEQLRCGASPDGLVEDNSREAGKEKGVIEVKCLRTGNHLYEILMFDSVPKKYIPQIQMEMWIAGRSFCDFIGYDVRIKKGEKADVDRTLETLQFFTKRVERDDEYIEKQLEPSVRLILSQIDREEKYFRIRARQLFEKNLSFVRG